MDLPLCVVTGRQPPGHYPLDGDQRHRLAARPEQVSPGAREDRVAHVAALPVLETVAQNRIRRECSAIEEHSQ